MKTIAKALKDAVHYSIPDGFVENVLIGRELPGDDECTADVMHSTPYRGVLADCLWSLVQAVSFSESDKSISSLTDKQLTAILSWANSIYESIGESAKEIEPAPTVYIGG